MSISWKSVEPRPKYSDFSIFQDGGRRHLGFLKLTVKRVRQDRTGKSHKRFIFHIFLWRSPHWSNVHENLFSRWCSRHKHVCHVSIWNFQGLRFYRGRIFHFTYCFLNGPYNSAALLRCLWLSLISQNREHIALGGNISSVSVNIRHLKCILSPIPNM